MTVLRRHHNPIQKYWTLNKNGVVAEERRANHSQRPGNFKLTPNEMRAPKVEKMIGVYGFPKTNPTAIFVSKLRIKNNTPIWSDDFLFKSLISKNMNTWNTIKPVESAITTQDEDFGQRILQENTGNHRKNPENFRLEYCFHKITRNRLFPGRTVRPG